MTHLYVNSLGPTISIKNLLVQNGLFPTRVLSLSLSLCLFFSSSRPFHPQNRYPTSRNPNLAKLSKSNCAKPQHHQSEWCSSSSSWTCLCNTPVPLRIWTWLKDLVAPHFPASTALDLSLISNSRKPTRRNPRLWTLNTTQVFDVAHLPHLQLVNPSRHCGSAEEKLVSPLLVHALNFSPFSWFCLFIS